jgi:Na+(H+)/acetate symporter ActP
MSHTLEIWLLIGFALVAANLPFVNERLFIVGPRLADKSIWWRLLEVVLMALLTLALGTGIEMWIGQRHVQSWEFYAAALSLFLTFAFPGFVWRYLRRRPREAEPELS